MKIIIVLVLCLLSVQPIHSFADYKDDEYYISSIEKDIKKALLKKQSVININKYKIKVDSQSIINELTHYIPYFNTDIQATLYKKGNYYYQIKIKYKLNKKEIKKHVEDIDKKVKNLSSVVSKKYSDEKNSLLLHDYMVNTYQYDIKKNKNSYYSGGLLKTGKGVCQSYAYLYKYILNKADVECYYIRSASMNHAWNMVKIDNYYYHTDVSGDDPSKDKIGIVSHKYFLCSDAYMKNKGYKNWDRNNIKCSSKKYDNYYFRNVNSTIIVNGSQYFYVKDRFLISADNKGNKKKVIDHVGYWHSSKGYYKDSYSGIFLKNFNLYYNKADKVYMYNLYTKKIKCVMNNKAEKQIFGIRNTGNYVEINKLSEINGNSNITITHILSFSAS